MVSQEPNGSQTVPKLFPNCSKPSELGRLVMPHYSSHIIQTTLFKPQGSSAQQFNETAGIVCHDPMRPDVDELAHEVGGIDGPVMDLQAVIAQRFN